MAPYGDDAILQGLAEGKKEDVVHDKEGGIDEKSGGAVISEGHYDKSASSDFDNDEGHEQPSEEDRHTLRRVSGPIALPAYLIGFVELCERFSYYGSTVVFTNFIQRPLPPGSTTGKLTAGTTQAGALGLGQRTSTAVTTFNVSISRLA